MTALQIVSDVAGKTIPDEEANFILWEYTGYPEFWHRGIDGDTPEECLRTQLKRHFAGEDFDYPKAYKERDERRRIEANTPTK